MKKLFQQLFLLVFLGAILIGIATAGAYAIMEGPEFIKQYFFTKRTKSITAVKEKIVEEIKRISPGSSDLKDSREKMNGETYIKINVFELYDLCESNEQKVKGKSYVMRGIVHKPTHLTDQGQFGLMRIVMWCCAADATAYGFRVPYEQLDSLENGTWVKVYGRPIKDLSEPIILENTENTENADETISKYKSVQKQWIFEPDHLEPTIEPKDPFITYWRQKEPFKY